MYNRPTRKLALLAVVLCSFIKNSFAAQPSDFYTIQQAQQCFHSKALAACQEKINSCLTQKQCEKQLQFYHDCNFEKLYSNQVFNGNCFKGWKDTAMASKNVIDCLDSQCNLAGYNSQVSLSVLYTCTAEALITHKIDCGQECQSVLEKEVSEKIRQQPINQVYSKLQKGAANSNTSVKSLIDIIKRQCIDEGGSIRKRQQQQNMNKRRNKQRLIQRMNDKNKDEEYLKQYDAKKDSQISPQEL